MEVIPAIDILGGRCVQLYQGDYARGTVYSDDPLEVAARWAASGAKRIHVIDLDGAKAGAPVNMGIIGDIATAVSARVQLGGGIRTVETARDAIAAGVSRVIIGTSAANGGAVVESVRSELGSEAVMVSVDAKDGYVALRGWTESTRISVPKMVKRVEGMGVGRFMYTDITRDGTLTEPNFRAIEDLSGRTALKMLVAGGISSIGHLLKLSELGVEAAIVGTAVYTGDIDLRQAIEVLGGS